MRKLCFAFLFLLGGLSHEIRNPINCSCVATTRDVKPKRRPT